MAPGFRFALAALLLVACGAPARPIAMVERAVRRATVAPPPPNAESHWQGLELSYDPELSPTTLPIDEADLVRDEGAAPLFAALAPTDRAALLRDGFVIVPTARARNHMGAFYTDLEEGEVPILITTDALFELAHMALSVALSEAEANAEKQALDAWLARVELRLASERRGASSDLVAPYRVALGFIAVARALEDTTYVPPADVSDVVGREKIAIANRAKISKSPLFGVPLDYRAFPRDPALWMRSWLALAPFALGTNENISPRLDLARVRWSTAAALLLARASDARVDRVASANLDRVGAIERFIAGSSDDLDLRALALLSPGAKIDLADGQTIAKVARVDKLRALARQLATPKLLDGELAGPSVRVLGASVPPDGVAMQALITPAVPLRTTPSALDVAAWLGSDEALEQISARGDDKLAGYHRALTTLFRAPLRDRHGSLYASSLDVVASMLAPSVSHAALAASTTRAFRAAELDSALSAWTTFRRDFSGVRAHLTTAPPSPLATPHATPALVYVAPEIEVIANLTALVRQTTRGLDALGAIAPGSPARAVLGDVDELLTVAFEVALLAANGEAPTTTQRAALATLPAWMASVESALGSETTCSVAVHRDQTSGALLEESTSAIETIYFALREPRTKRLVLAVGAHVPHGEAVK